MKRRTALLGSLAAAATRVDRAGGRRPVDLQLVLAVDVSRSIDEVEAGAPAPRLRRSTHQRSRHRRHPVGREPAHRGLLHRMGRHPLSGGGDRLDRDRQPRPRRAASPRSSPRRRAQSQSWTAVGAALAHRRPALRQFGLRLQAPRHRHLGRRPHQRRSAGRAGARPAGAARHRGQRPAGDDEPHELFGRPPDLTLDKYYEDNVIGGPGSFMIVADNFEHFGRAVRTKLVREISGIDVTDRPIPA